MPTSKRIGSFSQKGFQRNFLSLMKQKETEVNCCIDPLTSVHTVNSSSIIFSGSGTVDDPLSAIAISSSSANNGLSIFTDGHTVLGNNYGLATSLQTAKLINSREILFDDDNNLFISMDSLSVHDGGRYIAIGNNPYTVEGGGIQVYENSLSAAFASGRPVSLSVRDNGTGIAYAMFRSSLFSGKFFAGVSLPTTGESSAGFSFFDQVSGVPGNIAVGDHYATDDGAAFQMKGTASLGTLPSTTNATSLIGWDTVTHRLVVINPSRRSIAANGAINLADANGLIIVDTSAGNVTLTVDPSVLLNNTFKVKKLGIDTNSVIISATTGNIIADSGPQTTYSFSGPGASVTVDTATTITYIS